MRDQPTPCSLSGPSLTFASVLLLPAYAAAFLGSHLRPGRFNIWGAIIAVYVLATGIQGLQYVTGVQWLGDMFNGVALVVAVAFAALSPGLKSRRKRAAEADGGAAQKKTPAPPSRRVRVLGPTRPHLAGPWPPGLQRSACPIR